MLRVKVFDVDENGVETPEVDKAGKELVLDGEGLLLIIQTVNETDEENTKEVNGSLLVRGENDKIAMGNIINNDKTIRSWIMADRMNEMIGKFMDEVENDGNDEDGVTE